jgi:hypothetical protein
MRRYGAAPRDRPTRFSLSAGPGFGWGLRWDPDSADHGWTLVAVSG